MGVKVLDFGLAKDVNPREAPTAAATGAGVIMGTPAYMAPEQAAGLPADRRADVWAFGVPPSKRANALPRSPRKSSDIP
jgi:serine/threonine-protein kinase